MDSRRRLVGGKLALAAAVLLVAVAVALARGQTAAADTAAVDAADTGAVPRRAQRPLLRALAREDRGEWASAAAILEEFLADHPDQDHALLRYHLGRCLAALDRPGPAREEFRRAVTLQPRLADAWFGLGQAAHALGDYATAAEAFTRGFRTAAEPPAEALYFAAACHLRADDPAAAVPLLEELIRGRWGPPELDWYRALVQAALALEDPRVATPYLDALVAARPGDPEVWYLAYQFAAGRQDHETAAVALTIVGYLRDLTPAEERTLGDLYTVIGVPALAGDAYLAALSPGAGAAEYERLAATLLAAHDPDRALTILQQALASRPTARLWSLLGDVEIRRGDPAAAHEAFRQAVALDPGDGRAQLMLGYTALTLDRVDEAIVHLQRAATDPALRDQAEGLLRSAARR